MLNEKNIRDVSMKLFTFNDYEGVSLREIAEEVGIKKPSIYAHYNGKEDLFMKVLQYTFEVMNRRILHFFHINNHKNLEDVLYDFLVWIKNEFESNVIVRFWLRYIHFPPSALQKQIESVMHPFYSQKKLALIRYVKKKMIHNNYFCFSAQEVSVAYLTLIDGIVLDLQLGTHESATERLEVSWAVFIRGIKT